METKFERPIEIRNKIVMDSFCGDVRTDLVIDIMYVGGKLKAYSRDLDCYLQFPRDLRFPGARYICDARKVEREGATSFYSFYKGTVRTMNGKVVA